VGGELAHRARVVSGGEAYPHPRAYAPVIGL
jgi:hypothetical protein